MAGGPAFDPAEFDAYKAGRSGPAGGSAPSAPLDFDPAEFDAYKARRSTPPSRPGQTEFASRFENGPMASATDASSDPLAQGIRRVADERLVGKPGSQNAATVALLNAGNEATLNLAGNAAAGIASVLGGYSQSRIPGTIEAVTGVDTRIGGFPSRSFTENRQLLDDKRAALERQHPTAALAGTATGLGAGAFALPTLGGATAATLAGRAGQAALTGGVYGAVAEGLDSFDPVRALSAGGIGAVGGGVGSAAIERLAPHVLAGLNKASPALGRMLGQGKAVALADGGFTPEAEAAIRGAGLDPALVPAELAGQMQSAFVAKGVSPAVAREAQAAEFGLPLSAGQATADVAALGREAGAAAGNFGTKAQGLADTFGKRQTEAIETAGRGFAERAGRGAALDNPAQASELIADQAREAARMAGLEADVAQRGFDGGLAQIRGAAPIDPLDAGGAVARGLREAADAGRGRYRSAYDDVAQIEGEFAPGALDRIGTTVRSSLGADVPIDDTLTPAANRALRDLDNLPALFGITPGSGPTLQQVEQVRKRLGVYYAGTGQNPTDRRAINAIREQFDRHVGNATEAGLFGPRQAAQRVADAFPGDLPSPAAANGRPAAGGAPARKESLLPFLGRRGGIRLDDDARAADYGRIQTGFGPLGRKNGRTIEDLRDELASEGFIRPDDNAGMISRRIDDEIHDLIGLERSGSPVYRLADLSAGIEGRATRDVGGRLADQAAVHSERLGTFARQITDDLEAIGVRERDLDPDTLRDAADLLARGRYRDPSEAYEAAVMAREPKGGATTGDVPFDGPTAVAASDALPGAVPDVVAKMRTARSLFSEYQRTFKPQGAGDDVGLAMRKIVDRDADPVEVSRMLYAGNPGLNIRLADRVKQVVGENSETWAAHRQGYLSSILDGRDTSPTAVAQRINGALSGPKRGLTYRILSDEQVAGLRQVENAARLARTAREAVPDWIVTLGRSDFDANRVTADLFGSGVPGARPGSAAYAGGLKRFVGEESEAWSAVRLAAWQRLVASPDGSGMLPAAQVASRIREFTSGKGAGLARQLFEPALLADMRRFGSAVQTTTSSAMATPAARGTANKLASKALDAVSAGLAFKLGGLPGAGAMVAARPGSRAVEAYGRRDLRRSFDGGAPKVRVSLPGMDLRRGAIGVGLAGEDAVPR